MYQRAGTSSGGGSAQIKEGTFQTSASVDTIVNDVGFQPDYLYIESLDRVKAYYCAYIYTVDSPSDKIWRYFNKTEAPQSQWTGQTIQTTDTTRGTLLSIDSNGFTFSRVSGGTNYATAPECKYKAIKWS